MAIGTVGYPSVQPFPYENPFLSGMLQGNQIQAGFLENIQRALQNQATQAQLPFVGPQAEANLGLSQEQLEQARVLTPYVGQQAAAQIAQAGATTKHTNALTQQLQQQLALKKQLQQMMAPYLQGGNAQGAPAVQNPAQNPQQTAQFLQNTMQPQAQTQAPAPAQAGMGGPPNIPLPVATMMSSELGFTPHVVEADNKKYIVTPFGNYPIGTTGKLEASQEKIWDKALEGTNKSASAASDANISLKTMEDLYNEMSYMQSGIVGGRLPGLSSRASEFDKLAKGVAAQATKAVQVGHLTEGNFRTFERMKPERSMPEDAFRRFINFSQGMNQRAVQHNQFLDLAHDAGLTHNKAEQAWNKFINENNFFDSKTGQLIPQNLNDSKFQEYLKGVDISAPSENKSQKVIKWKRVNGQLVRE